MVEKDFTAKLLVEGIDDQHVIFAICSKHKIAKSFNVVDCKGQSNIIRQLSARLKEERNTAIGIVIDADLNVKRAWLEIVNIAKDLGYILPFEPVTSGYIHPAQTTFPRLGIWVMPGNSPSGMLEDFIKGLIISSSPLINHIEGVLDEVERLSYNKYNPSIHRSKAFVHTYLAWQEDPGTPMGFAITKHYFDYNATACLDLVRWLNELYNS